jgi:glycosyltransferase involved in cell wall biosynthesis
MSMNIARFADTEIKVSVMVFTLDEEENIEDCLDSVEWCKDIIIIDSGSVDKTRELTQRSNVRFYPHAFEGFGRQRNWAIANTCPRYDWILILDADERVPLELAEEIKARIDNVSPNTAAFKLRRRFVMWGRWLRYSSLYPTWVVRLVHKERVRYINRGHAETQEVNGKVASLENDLIDSNNNGIDAWFERQNRYSSQDARYELEQPRKQSSLGNLVSPDPLLRRAGYKKLFSKIPGRPVWYFLYSYFVRGGFLEGRDGLMFCGMRAMYQGMIEVKKYDLRRKDLVSKRQS